MKTKKQENYTAVFLTEYRLCLRCERAAVYQVY